MLQQLTIKNFALIDSLQVDLHNGFSIITGETGAGKSIILGGLGLILGKRADLSVLKNSDKKCIIEGEFTIAKYKLKPFFENNDIDYEEHTIIRREISPNGKSRAFINDSPAKLSVLNELGEKLIDIHSQHETLQLADTNFQFKIIDALASNATYLDAYKRGLILYNGITKELNAFLNKQKEAKLQYDYNLFLLNELIDANLKSDEQEHLENTLEKLNNIETIKQQFVEALILANNEEIGLNSTLNSFKNNLIKLATFGKDYQELLDRFTSVSIEFNDIVNELEKANDEIAVSPQEIENYNDRLQLIYDLQKKHAVQTIGELLEIQEELSFKVAQVDNASEILNKKEEELKEIENQLNKVAATISNNRKKSIPLLIKELEKLLLDLSMPNTKFKIELSKSETFLSNGKDQLAFLLSTNKGSSFKGLQKVASGGEMSRIMLAVKALLSKHIQLPTIIFDEIDTGVSGEVSNNIAAIMNAMSSTMQVISITHLPQIAAKGEHHYKVFKQEVEQQTITNIKKLNNEERITELAEMLSGKNLAASAIEHAKELLN